MENSEVLKKCLIIFFNLLVTSSFSQNTTLTGTIIDNKTKEPLPYANAIITSDKDSTILLGAIANNKGKFLIEDIPPGIYELSLSFIGYQTIHINEIIIQGNSQDIGLVKLNVLNENLDEVTIRTTKSPINYKIDRKVIDAKSFPGATVAIDLLENVPSIQVDFNGNLTYRGDGTFKVFINGHPVANGTDKLRQIPAEKIEKIEIITNPSAKYDAEGTAGIIQVILKRNRLPGYAINTSAHATTFGGYAWQFSVNKQDDNGSWYVEGAYAKNIWRKMDYDEQRNVKQEGVIYQTHSELKYENLGIGSYVEIGFNYDLTDFDYIDFSVYVNPLKSVDKRKTWGKIIDTEFNLTKKAEDYIYNNQYSCYYQYIGATLTYEHAFAEDRENLLSTYINFSNYLQPFQEKNIDIKEYTARTERAGFIGKENNEMMLETNLSYKNQFSEKISFETGIKTELNHIPKVISVSGKFDNDNNITPFSNAPLNQKVDFKQDVFAAYLMLKSSFDKFEYQLGIRTEFTDRKSDYFYENVKGDYILIPAKKQYVDFFPSVHTVCSFSEDHQLAINYSRRINRPDYWSLVPIIQYNTPYLYYKGNVNIMPAYSNAYEIAYKKSWNKDFIALEIFARNTKGII